MEGNILKAPARKTARVVIISLIDKLLIIKYINIEVINIAARTSINNRIELEST